MESTEIKEMVTDLALAIARRVIESTHKGGLDIGQITETVPVGDSGEWHLHAMYIGKDDIVCVSGHPVRPMPDGMLGGLFQAIQASGGQVAHGDDVDAAFQFMLPAAWLPS